MRTRIRLGLAAGAVLAGLFAGALLAPVPVAGAAATTANDAIGDTVTDAVREPIKAPRADIVSTLAESRADGIALNVRLQQSVDPLTDPNWSSTVTIITWNFDVNGDSSRDYEIEYSVEPETKQLSGSLYRLGNAPRPAKGCDSSASYSMEGGHAVLVDPKCLGNPTAFSYRVDVVYDTNVNDDGADYATDASPDQGWSSAVAVHLPPGVTPATAPPVSTPIAPLEAPSDSEPGDPGSAGPPASAPQAPTPSPTKAQTPIPAKPVLPAQVTARSSASEAAAPAPAASAPGLAHTGLSDRAVRMAGFASGIALIGIGLLFANRRPSVR